MTRRRTRNGFIDEDDASKTATTPFNGTVRPFVASEHPVTPAEAYGFVGIVASALLFLFHLLLLFSPPLNEEEERHQKEEESALIRFVSFSKHHAKALPLWTTLCVILYVVLVESSSRMKVYDLRDGRLFAREEEKKKREKKKSVDASSFVVGRQSVSASAWNEALFSGRKREPLP